MENSSIRRMNKRFVCLKCKHVIDIPYGTPKPLKCPYCGAPGYMLHRIDKGPRNDWIER